MWIEKVLQMKSIFLDRFVPRQSRNAWTGGGTLPHAALQTGASIKYVNYFHFPLIHVRIQDPE